MLLRGGRLSVTAVFSGVLFFCVLAGLYLLLPTLRDDRALWLFNGLVNGLLSLVTIVLTINQVILSRQFGSPADLYERFESRLDFRERVEADLGAAIVPPSPPGFMSSLFRALRGRAVELRGVEFPDDAVGEEVGSYADRLFEQTDAVTNELESTRFEMEGLIAVLDYDDTWPFYVSRRIQDLHGDELDEEGSRLLEEVRSLLKDVDTARQYFKTVFLQRELATLSRRIVVFGVLAIVVASVTILTYRNEWTATLGQSGTYLLVSALVAVTLLPVSVLFAYALRLATVTRRTVVFGPFAPREEKRADADWSE